MSSNPYENEPGFENKHEESDKKDQINYTRKVQGPIVTQKACKLTFQ